MLYNFTGVRCRGRHRRAIFGYSRSIWDAHWKISTNRSILGRPTNGVPLTSSMKYYTKTYFIKHTFYEKTSFNSYFFFVNVMFV